MIVAGAWTDSTFGDGAGTAYVFRCDGTEWIKEAKLFASDAEPWDRFGGSLDVDGDVMVVGAMEYLWGGHVGPGSAYVFRYIGDQWIETETLRASDGEMDDCFGSRVRIEDETIMVGAGGADAYYYFKCVGDTWAQRQKIGMSGVMEFSGNYMILGRYMDDDLGEYSGSALIYECVDDIWVFRQKLLASDGAAYQKFGEDVSIFGDTALIGSLGATEEEYVSAWAYVFRLTGGSWQEVTKLDSGGPLWWEFGDEVALGGDHAIVAAPAPYGNEVGKVFLYAGMTGVDCNDNGTADGCDIFLGTSEDMNENGIPDECECPGDFDGDGDVDTADLLYLLGAWGTPAGDVDGDGDTDTADLLALLGAWGDCP